MEKKHQVQIKSAGVELTGDLCIPEGASGLVLFAHGSGSSRLSPRNRYVANVLQDNAIATLLIDLLTPNEEIEKDLRFDISLLAERLVGITDWLEKNTSLTIGYFGASTGAAAALVAAAKKREKIRAIVSRGGRPDLAGSHLAKVTAPTLLIVGGEDPIVISLNEEALGLLTCPKQLVIVPGASHLFEESGTLEDVARIASRWFKDHL
jgi:pimeloyl-ACP methyl ester carboxylesterase